MRLQRLMHTFLLHSQETRRRPFFHCSLMGEQTAPRVSEKTSLSLGYFQLEAAASWRVEEKIKEGQRMHVVLY